jgi:acetyl-CoA carboxylase carboxyl transferase subunit beta
MTEVIGRPLDVAEYAPWELCSGCGALVYGRWLARNLRVCPECGRHHRLTAPQRLAQLLDEDSVRLLDLAVPTGDPLDFVDTKPYPTRVAEARRRTGLGEAVLCGRGEIHGCPVVVAVMDFRFLGGSLGTAVGELITRAAEEALRTRTPLLLVTASGGARMQEGTLALMQMAKTAAALGLLDEAGVLTISLVTDPTFGGVAASFATLADVIIAEPGARLGFAGRRVIEQTIGERLPAQFQTAEFLVQRGLIDGVRPRSALRGTLSRLLSVGARRLPSASVDAGEASGAVPVVRDPGRLPERDPWEVVRRARDLGRPTTTDYLALLLDDFEELRGDRLGGDCAAIVGGLGWLGAIPLVVIGHQKGHTISELTEHNFGMPRPAGYRKAARLMRLGAKLGLPVVTFIDTPGAYPGRDAEEQGQAVAIAENLRLMAGLPVPTVAVVTGEGGSGGALALGVADEVLVCENAVYSIISPEGCAAILWHARSAAPAAAAALRLTPRDLLRLGIVDGVIREPAGGAERDHQTMAEHVRVSLVAAVGRLASLEAGQRISERLARYRRYTVDSDDMMDIEEWERNR